ADILTLSYRNLNALDLALLKGHTETAKYLLSLNANLCHKINDKISTYDIANFKDLKEILPLIELDETDKTKKHRKLSKKNFKFAEKNIRYEIFDNKHLDPPDISDHKTIGVNYKKNK
ncbi:MAG: hypothetical protein J7K64_07985, partial [Bacteroidales bacterium]|nr:hypothetical protein [Bacteroidales bacterium]